MTEAQEDAVNELRRKVQNKYTGALSGYTVEVSVDDVREILQLVDELLER